MSTCTYFNSLAPRKKTEISDVHNKYIAVMNKQECKINDTSCTVSVT